MDRLRKSRDQTRHAGRPPQREQPAPPSYAHDRSGGFLARPFRRARATVAADSNRWIKKRRKTMARSQPSAAREQVRDIVPGLIDLSERVLLGEVWERPGLSKRDRSLIVCATLIALGRERQLVGHLQRALDNGLTKNELGEVITHLAFYAGWPAAMTAALVAKEVFEKR